MMVASSHHGTTTTRHRLFRLPILIVLIATATTIVPVYAAPAALPTCPAKASCSPVLVTVKACAANYALAACTKIYCNQSYLNNLAMCESCYGSSTTTTTIIGSCNAAGVHGLISPAQHGVSSPTTHASSSEHPVSSAEPASHASSHSASSHSASESRPVTHTSTTSSDDASSTSAFVMSGIQAIAPTSSASAAPTAAAASSGLSTGVMAGIGAGILIAVGGVGFCFLSYMKKGKSSSSSDNDGLLNNGSFIRSSVAQGFNDTTSIGAPSRASSQHRFSPNPPMTQMQQDMFNTQLLIQPIPPPHLKVDGASAVDPFNPEFEHTQSPPAQVHYPSLPRSPLLTKPFVPQDSFFKEPLQKNAPTSLPQQPYEPQLHEPDQTLYDSPVSQEAEPLIEPERRPSEPKRPSELERLPSELEQHPSEPILSPVEQPIQSRYSSGLTLGSPLPPSIAAVASSEMIIAPAPVGTATLETGPVTLLSDEDQTLRYSDLYESVFRAAGGNTPLPMQSPLNEEVLPEDEPDIEPEFSADSRPQSTASASHFDHMSYPARDPRYNSSASARQTQATFDGYDYDTYADGQEYEYGEGEGEGEEEEPYDGDFLDGYDEEDPDRPFSVMSRASTVPRYRNTFRASNAPPPMPALPPMPDMPPMPAPSTNYPLPPIPQNDPYPSEEPRPEPEHVKQKTVTGATTYDYIPRASVAQMVVTEAMVEPIDTPRGSEDGGERDDLI